MQQNNTASDPTTITPVPPDLSLAKTPCRQLLPGASRRYGVPDHGRPTLGAGPSTGTVTVVDTLPAGLRPATADRRAPAGPHADPHAPASRSDALAAIASYPAITLTVNVAANAPASVTNTATVSGGGDINAGNNTATDPTSTVTVRCRPISSIAKTHVGNFAGSDRCQLRNHRANVGTGPSSGVVTVIDTLPAGLTASAISGTGWTCTVATLTCTRSDVLAIGLAFPVITLTVNVAASAPASVTNTVTMSGGSDANAANNTASDPTTVTAQTSDLSIAKTHVGNFSQGQAGASYAITVTNSGAVPSSGTAFP